MDENFENIINEEVTRVFANNPFIRDRDHRENYPWLTGFLGNPKSKVMFIAENPSLHQIHMANEDPKLQSKEMQWNVSRSDKKFRQMLVENGFKEGTIDNTNGWNCYITYLVKIAVKPKNWKMLKEETKFRIAKWFSTVLQKEIDFINPSVVVVMGLKTTKTMFDRLVAEGFLKIPQGTHVKYIWHYSYFLRGGWRKEYLEKYATKFRELKELVDKSPKI